MATHHGGTGHTDEDRDINSSIDITTKEETGGIDIGPDNDNESTNSLDTMFAFRGSEVDGHLSDLLPSSQAKLTIHTREIMTMSGGWRRTAIRGIGLQRTGTTKSFSHSGCKGLQSQHLQSLLEKRYANTWTHYAPHRSKQISQIHCYRTLPSSMNMIHQN